MTDPRLPVHEGRVPIYSEKHDRCYFANPEKQISQWTPPNPVPKAQAAQVMQRSAQRERETNIVIKLNCKEQNFAF